jgi:REP element-mobilizing transposase RayT
MPETTPPTWNLWLIDAAKKGVRIWSYCVMPNHAHLIAVPSTEDGLRRAIGEAYRRYTRRIGHGAVRRRIWRVATTAWSRSHLCWR